MLVRIFSTLKIDIDKNIIRTLISYCTTCLIGNLSSAIIALLMPIAADLAKFIPVFGHIASFLAGPITNAIMVYVYGVIFMKALLELCKSGKDISEKELKVTIKKETANSSSIKESMKEAKNTFKNTDFTEYKKAAEDVFAENKDKDIHYEGEK